MQACQFITFGKLPSSASASFSTRNRFHDMTSRIEVSQQLQQPQRRQSGTETGPLLSRVAENQPNDTSGADNWSDVDDVFGSSCVRSVSVPPRLGYRPICHSKSSNAAISGLYNTNTEHVSPPRMKRRKKKTSFAAVEQPETVSMAVRPDAIIINTDVAKTSNSVKQQLITKRLPLLPASASAEAELLTFGGAGEKCRSFSSSSSSDRFFAFDPNIVSSAGSSVGCSGKVDGGSESAAGTGAGRKKKYSIRWQSDGPQSSPDLNSDDADSKESGYITLEDLQAQLGGRSSWSSDDRGSGQTDQDVGEISSGDEKRSEVLHASVGAAIASSTSKSRGTSKIAEADAEETAVDKTVAVLKTATTDTGIAGGSFGARRAVSRIVPPPLESLDCCGSGMASPFFECRSAPPTCDSSLLRFTFTVRLDSKMFHRRMTQRSPTPVADDFRAITDGRDGLQRAIVRQPMALPGRIDLLVEDASVSFVRKTDGSSTGVTLVPSNNDVTKQPFASLTEVQTSSKCTDAKDEVDCCMKAEKTVSTVSSEHCQADDRQVECINDDLTAVNCATPNHTEQFVGEKVVIKAEVHRSADQLDSELPTSSRARTIGPPKSPLKNFTSQDAPGGGSFAADDAQHRRFRTRNTDSDDCVIRSLDSANATPTTPGSQQLLMDRDSRGNGTGAMWNSFHGCVRHVEVDRVMINEKGVASTTKRTTEHRSMTSAEVRNGTTIGKDQHQQGSKEHAQKSADASRCGMTIKKAVKKNFSNEDEGSNGCVSGTRQLTSQCSRNASEVSHNGVTCSAGLTEGKTLVRGNKAGATRRVFQRRHGGQRRSGSGESSSLSSEGGGVSESDDNELCSPCLMHTSANGAVITKLSNSCCHRHHHFVPRDETVDKLSSGKSRGDSTQSNGQNRKHVRRTLRQFFRVENLFACRQHSATATGKSIQNGHGPDVIDGRRLAGTETSTTALTTSTGSGNSCMTPTDVVPSNGSGNGCRWFHASRSVQRSAAGRSPSTSAVDRRSRQRSSRRSAASSATISQHHHHQNGTSRSVSPSTRRSATTMMRQRSRQPADAVAGEDGDDERTMRFHCHKTSDGCHCRSERTVAVCGDGTTVTVDRRNKIVRHHHHAAGGSGWDTVDGCPMTAPPTIAVDCFGNSGGTSERLWTTMSTSDSAALCQPHQRRRQQAATPAVTPISPSTPADDMILSSPAERFTTCTLSATNQGVQSPGIDFIKSLSQLQHCVWYWGALGFDEAEAKLADKPDGTFLVRDSSDDRYILSLSFRSLGATHHTRIEHYKGMFSFYAQPQSHSGATIVEFIDTAVTESRAGRCLYYLRPRGPGRSPAPVRLLHPLSRLRCMHSLKHLCKFTILRYVRLDLVDRLPVSPRLKEYLKHSGCPDGTAGNGHATIKPNSDRADGTCSKSRRTEGFHS